MLRALYEYQRRVFAYTGRVQHPALFLEMRLGKTLITVRRVKYEFPNTSGILIVAPLCALYGWETELLKEGVPASEITYLTGTKADRHNALCNRGAFCLINKEGFLYLPQIGTHNWDCVVADESTFLKNPKSKVSRFFSRNFRTVKRRFILTGTPAPENDLELFQQLYFLDPQILGFKNYWEFRHQFFEQPREYEWCITHEGRAYVETRLKSSCYVLSRKDVRLDTPKVYERRKPELPPAIRKMYETVKKEFILEMHGETVAATSFAMTKFLWLRRICGGIVNGECVWDGKVKETVDILQSELSNDSVVLWAQFLDEIRYLERVFSREGISYRTITGSVSPNDRVERMKSFQQGACRILLGQPECFKYGVDLSCSDTVIYFSSPLGLETRLQSEDRVINVKNRTPVLILDMLTRDTIDEDIYDALLNKESQQDMLKRMITR